MALLSSSMTVSVSGAVSAQPAYTKVDRVLKSSTILPYFDISPGIHVLHRQNLLHSLHRLEVEHIPSTHQFISIPVTYTSDPA